MDKKQYFKDEYTKINKILNLESSNNFMNHGYSPPCEGLQGYHKIFEHQSSLYINLIKDFDTKNKSLLDIGCGRGGGVDLFNQNLSFSRVVGLDLNPQNIEYCTNNIKGVEFFNNDAENLPFKDNTFDFITNVESAHCYQNIDSFFNEVKRVLKPGGFFLYTDVFQVDFNQSPTYNSLIVENKLPFKKIIKEDITKNVQKACKKDYSKWKNVLTNPKQIEFHTNISKEKFMLYSLNELKYITYTCYN
jgi:fatty-acid O-methyltransferase